MHCYIVTEVNPGCETRLECEKDLMTSISVPAPGFKVSDRDVEAGRLLCPVGQSAGWDGTGSEAWLFRRAVQCSAVLGCINHSSGAKLFIGCRFMMI